MPSRLKCSIRLAEGHRLGAPDAVKQHVEMIVIGGDNQVDRDGRIGARDQLRSFRNIIDHGATRQMILSPRRQGMRRILLVFSDGDDKALRPARDGIAAHAAHHQGVTEPK